MQVGSSPQSAEFDAARAVMLGLCPVAVERLGVLRRLLTSADAASAIAPNAWAVTLFTNGFRLNVGQVEAVVFVDGVLRINLCGTLGNEPFDGPGFIAAGYRSLSEPLCAFEARPKDYQSLSQQLETAHLRFLKSAATTSAGRPRKGTPFRRSHCEGLMRYARSVQLSDDRAQHGSDSLLTDAALVAAGAGSRPKVADTELSDIDLSLSALEGTPRLVSHFRRERSRKLVEAKKAAVLAERGALACEACGFDFSRVYGAWAGDFCEVHHRVALAQCADKRAATTTTTLSDLAIVCSNCHRVVHRVSPMPTVEALAERIREQRG